MLQNSLSAKNNADIIAHAINVYFNYTCAANKLFVSLIIILQVIYYYWKIKSFPNIDKMGPPYYLNLGVILIFIYGRYF